MVKKKVAGLNYCTVLGEVLCKLLKDIAKDWYKGVIYTMAKECQTKY